MNNKHSMISLIYRVIVGSLSSILLASLPAHAIDLERIVIDDNFPGAYQVEVADVNGDKKLDVIAVGGSTCAWYENPTWKKRVVTGPKQTPGIITSATADLDGDGKAEIAIGYEFEMNEPARGKLLLASQGKSSDDAWTFTPIADIPSMHRLRWGHARIKPRVSPGSTPNGVSVSLEKQRVLMVGPLFGPKARPPIFDQDPAHLVALIPADSPKTERWQSHNLGLAPVSHAIDMVDLDGDGLLELLGASNLGVTEYFPSHIAGALLFSSKLLAPGAPGTAPRKGASELHLGHLKDGRRFLATVEPWHGAEVAVYFSESHKPLKFGPRHVIDSTLKEGHALWVADVDGDGDDEIFAGYRGLGTSVLAFDFNGKEWERCVVDNKIAAQDLRGGDLDGDGTPDVVAVGGSTHNVVWYRPTKK